MIECKILRSINFRTRLFIYIYIYIILPRSLGWSVVRLWKKNWISDRGQFENSARSNFLPAGKTFYRAEKQKYVKMKKEESDGSDDFSFPFTVNNRRSLNFTDLDNGLERIILPFDPSLSRSKKTRRLRPDSFGSLLTPFSFFVPLIPWFRSIDEFPMNLSARTVQRPEAKLKGGREWKREEDSDSRYQLILNWDRFTTWMGWDRSNINLFGWNLVS